MKKLFTNIDLFKLALLWNPLTQTDDENVKWCWLRAVEWDAFILFVTQPLIPLFILLNIPVIIIIAILLILNWIWQLIIAYKYVNVLLADLSSLFVHLKWFVSIGIGIYFFVNSNYMNAVLAATWPIIVLVLTFLSNFIRPHKAEIGIVQTMFMEKLGYQKNQDLIK